MTNMLLKLANSIHDDILNLYEKYLIGDITLRTMNDYTIKAFVELHNLIGTLTIYANHNIKNIKTINATQKEILNIMLKIEHLNECL